MPIHSVALKERTLIPVEFEPVESLQDGLGVFRLGTVAVGILDAENEHAFMVPSEEPVEQRGASTTDV
jgi:hypothetical protein